MLARLSPLRRRKALTEILNEGQRRELENFIVSLKKISVPAREDISACVDDDTESSFSETSTDDEDHVADKLAIAPDIHMSPSDAPDYEAGEILAICDDHAISDQPCAFVLDQSRLDDDRGMVSLDAKQLDPSEASTGACLISDDMPVDDISDGDFTRCGRECVTRGLAKWYCASGRRSRYRAFSFFDPLQVSTRWVKDLATAIDYTVVLSEFKQRALANIGVPIHEGLKEALAHTLEAHNLTVLDLGLSFTIRVWRELWLGKRWLLTPVVHDVDLAIFALQRLQPHKYRLGKDSLLQLGPAEYERRWDEFKTGFIEVSVAFGRSRNEVESALQEREEASRASRESRYAANFKRIERKFEANNRRVMAREDRASRQQRRQSTREDKVALEEDRIIEKLLRLSEMWKTRAAKRDSKRLAREAAERKAAAVRARADAVRARKAKLECLAYARRDLTMDELFSCRRQHAGTEPPV